MSSLRPTAIAKLAEVRSGGGAPQDPSAFSAEGHPFVRAGSLSHLLNGHNEGHLEKILPDVARHYSLRLFPKGTVLFAKSGMSATKGYIYALKRPAYVVSHLAALMPHDPRDSGFLVRALQRFSPTSLIQDQAYPSIRLGDIEQMEILAPDSLEERERIAAILDKADALRRKHKRLEEIAAQLGHSIFWSVHERTQHIAKEFRLADVAQNGSGNFGNGPFGSDLLTSELRSEGVPVVYIRDIVTQEYVRVSESFVTKTKAETLAACAIKPRDLLITKVGDPPGVATVYPDGEPNAIITQDVIRLRPDPAIAVPEYLAYLLNSSLGKHLIAGITVAATRARFSLRDLKQLKISLPSIEEQHAFKAQIDLLNRTKRAELAAREMMSSMFESLQHRAFSDRL